MWSIDNWSAKDRLHPVKVNALATFDRSLSIILIT